MKNLPRTNGDLIGKRISEELKDLTKLKNGANDKNVVEDEAQESLSLASFLGEGKRVFTFQDLLELAVKKLLI
jgi:hypothetical protein